MKILIRIIISFFFHFIISFFLYSASLCFSPSGRFLYCSPLYCRFFSFSFLERLWYLLQAFWVIFIILITFSWWIFRQFYICKKIKDKRNLFKLKEENETFKDTIIRGIRNLFKHEKGHYYKPLRVGYFWSGNYLE